MSISPFDIALLTKLGPEYDKKCTMAIKVSLSGLDYDIAYAMLWTNTKSSDMINNDRFGLIYDSTKSKRINKSRLYEWNYETKLWEPYDNPECILKIKYFDVFNGLLKSLRMLLSRKIHESKDDSIRECGESDMRSVTKVIRKCSMIGSMNTIWKCIKEIVSMNFSDRCNNASKQLPLNDGTLYNIENKERRMRTPNDLYTYTVNDSSVVAPGLYLNVIRTDAT